MWYIAGLVPALFSTPIERRNRSVGVFLSEVFVVLEDLTGCRFGKLVVLGYDHSEKKKRYWKCQCDCGNTSVVPTAQLKYGNTSSCGCGKVPEIIDLTGKRFGRLTVIRKLDHNPGEDIKWECVCDCGNRKSISGHSLKKGNTLSCGCLQREAASMVVLSRADPAGPRHKSRLYKVWKGMRARCNNPNHSSYPTYGGKGIRVCQEWEDYSVFRSWALESGYDENAPYMSCTLDRIDRNGNYSPDNCRWVDSKTQSRNTERNVILEYGNEKYIAADLADKFGKSRHTVIEYSKNRINLEEYLSSSKSEWVRRTRFKKRVICAETGKEFPSVKDAASFIGISASAISVSLSNPNRTAGGYHWKYAD